MIVLSDLPTGRLGELQSAHWALSGSIKTVNKSTIIAKLNLCIINRPHIAYQLFTLWSGH